MRFPVRPAQGVLLALAVFVAMAAAAQDPSPTPAGNPPAQPAPSSQPAPPSKSKKIYTNDDVAAAPPASPSSAKTKTAVTNPDANARLAHDLKARLDKLNVQLSATDNQLDQLRKFQAGETSGNSGHQIYKGYSTEPIPEQIQKLEAKRQQIAAQIDAIYDEARKKGILPGQLR